MKSKHNICTRQMCVCVCSHTLFSILSFILSPFSSIFHILSTHTHTFAFLVPAFRQYLYYTNILPLAHTQIQCDKITFKISCYRQNTLNETICSLKRNIMHSISPLHTDIRFVFRLFCAGLLAYLYFVPPLRFSFAFN